jgi:hypothetical protein
LSDDNPLAINREPWEPERQRRLKIRWIVGAAGMLFLLLSAGCVGCFLAGGRKSAQGAEFAEGFVGSFVRSWDADALINSASPEFLESSGPTKTRQFVSFVAERLGTLEKCGVVQNDQWRVTVDTRGLTVVSSHHVDCQFAGGNGSIILSVRERAGAWEVLSLNVNSDALMRPGAPPKLPEGPPGMTPRSSS